MSFRSLDPRILIGIVALFCATAVLAQAPSGSLHGTVVDSAGQPLPGASVTLSGNGAPLSQQADMNGTFRFLGLSPGEHQLLASLDGFSDVRHTKISIGVGRNTSLVVEMSPAIEETLTVTTEGPLLDERRIKTGTTVSEVELERVPSARDPWAVLETVPGVLLDRINVGGNESSTQANFVGPGSTGADAVWAIDGVVITDMSAVGASPTFYNFDAFEEMDISTGGADAALATSGVTMNMVTKRGTNEWRGSARYLRSDEDWQDSLEIDSSDLGEDFDGPGPVRAQRAFGQGNRIVQVQDWGLELGGPVVEDKVWIWANYGVQNVDLLTIFDIRDNSDIEAYGGKLNAQLSPKDSFVGFYNFGSRQEVGMGASPTRAQESTWIQDAPTDIFKLENTHVFGPSFYLTGMASYVDSTTDLTPFAGLDGPSARLDENFSWTSNFLHHTSDRPQKQVKIDGDYFFNAGAINHELKFGVGYRTTRLESLSAWPGNTLRMDYLTSFGAPFNLVQVSRPKPGDFETDYTSLYVQDTLTAGQLTANIGLRYDQQNGRLNEMTAPAVPGFETLADGSPLFPQATAPARDVPFEWTDLTPRLGVTWALGKERDTLLRASFSQFAKQLGQENVSLLSPLSYSYTYWYYDDTNNDGNVTRDEILFYDFGPVRSNTFDPLGQTVMDQIDPDYEAGITSEFLLGVEHAFLPELVVGLTFNYRNIDKIRESFRFVRDILDDGSLGDLRPVVREDFVLLDQPLVTRPDGSTFTSQIWEIGPHVVETADRFVTNGPREQDYRGLTLSINKRLANRWMLRGHFQLSEFVWDLPADWPPNPNSPLGGGSQDGDVVLQGSATGTGSRGGVYLNSEWSYSLTGLYQIAPNQRWGFNVAASINGRQGFAIPYFAQVFGLFEDEFSTRVSATRTADEFRNEDSHMVNLRLEKDFRIKDLSFTVGAEVFNLFNEGTVLQRNHRLGRANSNHVTEVLSPRVMRFGVRLKMR